MRKAEPILTPELIRIMKIFGLASLCIVLIFSFFNERRANNSGDSSITRITASSRLFFENVRQIKYEKETRRDAKMDIFRLKKRIKSKKLYLINLSIIISRLRDEAYIFVEPSEILSQQNKIQLRWHDQHQRENGQISFEPGDRFAHFDFVKKLFLLLEEDKDFEVKINGAWKKILADEKERKAFITTATDYFRLVEKNQNS
ncbi:hypothetical protein QWY93_07090 [Echinicola jeungdonensis]|uniref:Uncharacterized protein n=1 Tax=Echinicola jeungdonensis TaxID=709343 RepID=A0ABV5J7E0_9BACT|nr:hypothetical protein [Echinicola jeungdonensis]MDN3669088.1 hypothetical protein [Echinicola jeungdonensis]